MRHCAFCDQELASGPPQTPGPGRRLAYDPWKGRLWEVCPGCTRWNPVPLELRWEVLEECEARVREEGRIRLRSENLVLVRVGEGELIRVGEPPRVEFAGWRYGERLPPPVERRRGLWSRIVAGLPTPPVGGYDPYGLRGMGGMGSDAETGRWLASPFLEQAQVLTLAFASVPLAPACPSCGRPLALEPWEFQNLAFRESGELAGGRVGLRARCGLCGTEVLVDPREGRAGLRLGMALVTAGKEGRRAAESAAAEVDRLGGPARYLGLLARGGTTIGELGVPERMALRIVLDEAAEREALEAEWRRAEEIASIMDGELTEVEGFLDFRRRILGDVGG